MEHILSHRKCETFTVDRAKAVTSNNLDKFFDIVDSFYKKCNITDGSRVFNLDETGLTTEQRLTNCFFRRGGKDVSILSPTCGKTMFTVLCCGNALGEVMPPCVIYKALHLYDSWCKGGPENTFYGATKSGWMETDIFNE